MFNFGLNFGSFEMNIRLEHAINTRIRVQHYQKEMDTLQAELDKLQAAKDEITGYNVVHKIKPFITPSLPFRLSNELKQQHSATTSTFYISELVSIIEKNPLKASKDLWEVSTNGVVLSTNTLPINHQGGNHLYLIDGKIDRLKSDMLIQRNGHYTAVSTLNTWLQDVWVAAGHFGKTNLAPHLTNVDDAIAYFQSLEKEKADNNIAQNDTK